MSYIKKTVTAGKTVTVRVYHNRRQKSKNSPRVRTGKPTNEDMQRVNLKACEDRLTWLMNENFRGGDLSIVLNYPGGMNKTRTPEQMQTDMQKYLRLMRAQYRKKGIEFRFVYTFEIGPRGSRHIHITQNYIDVRIIQSCWAHGRIRFEALDRCGDYRKLAAYYIKYSEKTFRTVGRLMGKRYSRSRNLREPVIRRKIVKRADTFSKKVNVPKGFYLDKNSVESGVDLYGNEYYRYTLIRLE